MVVIVVSYTPKVKPQPQDEEDTMSRKVVNTWSYASVETVADTHNSQDVEKIDGIDTQTQLSTQIQIRNEFRNWHFNYGFGFAMKFTSTKWK